MTCEERPARPVDVLFQFIAEAAAAMAGFRSAILNVVRGDQYEVVAVTGSPETRAFLLGQRAELGRLMRWVAVGQNWGTWLFIEAGSHDITRDELVWRPDLPIPQGPEGWHPEDMLFAPLYDGDVLIGMLCLDEPVDGLRPDPAKRAFLGPYADEAARALRAALDAENAAERQRQIEELRSLDQYRLQFIDTMTHELRNPLAAIQGCLEILGDLGGHQDTAADVLRSAGRSAERIAGIVDDLLDLSRVTRPVPRDPVPVDLNLVAEGVLRSLDPSAAVRGVSWRLGLADGAGVVVGDEGELTLVLSNLVSNAVKYSPDGGEVRVEVSDGPDSVIITCADHGIGIPEDDLERLFEEFYRSGDPRARAQVGTGLGLAVVDRVVRRHGGFVSVESHVGRGTTFTVVLPKQCPGLAA